MNAYIVISLILILIILTPLVCVNLFLDMDETERGKIGISLRGR